jgi:hypothetical protein
MIEAFEEEGMRGDESGDPRRLFRGLGMNKKTKEKGRAVFKKRKRKERKEAQAATTTKT